MTRKRKGNDGDAADPAEDTTPIVNVNKKGQLEDAEGKPIVDESGKPIVATKEQVQEAKEGGHVKVTEEQNAKAEESIKKASDAIKAEDERIEKIPVVIVNKEGKLEDH